MSTSASTTIIQIPFAGFYESMWDTEIDRQTANEAEYLADEPGDDREKSYPEVLRFSADALLEFLNDCTDHTSLETAIGRLYAEHASAKWSKALGIPLGLEFESIRSPHEYNFETDRLFCRIPVIAVHALFERSTREGHASLAKTIAERHASRSGFISFYPDDLDTWLRKPLREWDHNELTTLLTAVLRAYAVDTDETENEALEGFSEADAWENAVDWKKFETLRAEKRDALLEKLREDDPTLFAELSDDHDSLRKYRCPNTGDLFA